MTYLPTQPYMMYNMKMQAMRTATISMTPNSDPDELQLHSVLSSFAMVSRLKFVCQAWISISSSWLEQELPIVEGLIEAVLTLETFSLVTPLPIPLAFIRPDLYFTTSSLLSSFESAWSVAFSSEHWAEVASFSSMSLSAAGISRLVLLLLISFLINLRCHVEILPRSVLMM